MVLNSKSPINAPIIRGVRAKTSKAGPAKGIGIVSIVNNVVETKKRHRLPWYRSNWVLMNIAKTMRKKKVAPGIAVKYAV